MVYMTTATDTDHEVLDDYGYPLECTDDRGEGTCRGLVEYHLAPSGSSIPRCDLHNAERWENYQNSDLERYADSAVPPAWFDPSICGERWDDDY